MTPMHRIRMLSLLCLIVIAAVTFVNAQTNSPPTDRSSPVTTATPVPIASLPAIPEILKNPQLLQLVFAKLQQETDRANAEAEAKRDVIAQREEWKKIADREAARADELEKADKARIAESTDLRASVGFLRTSVDEYKAQHAEDTRTINGLRSQRKWIAFGGGALGAAAGFGICKAGVR